MDRAGSLAVVALLLAAQVAVAAPTSVSGALTTSGLLRIAPSASGSAIVGAVFWPNVSGMSELTLVSPRLRVDVYEFELIESPLRPYLINNSRSLTLRDARASLAEPPTEGWAGYYATAQGDRVDLSTRTLVVEPTRETLGNVYSGAGGEANSGYPYYEYVPDAPYLLGRGAADVTRDGPVTLKVHGPTLRIAGAEGEATYWTGTRPSEKTPGLHTLRWIVLTSGDATFHAASSAEAQLALRSAGIQTHGEVSVRQASGTLEAASGAYVATGEDAILSGDLEVALAPSPEERQPTLRADVDGALTSTTLDFARAPVPAGPSPSFFLFGAAGVATLAAAAVVVARHAVRHRDPRFTPEQLVDLAYNAGDVERFAEALEWIRRAREMAPTSERLKMDEAYFLAKLHDNDGALALFDEVSRTSATGEADFHAAILMIETGEALEEIRPRLLRALERTPLLALEISDDTIFAEARRDREIARAISLALRKLDSGAADFE